MPSTRGGLRERGEQFAQEFFGEAGASVVEVRAGPEACKVGRAFIPGQMSQARGVWLDPAAATLDAAW
ncbi:hypothetical protein TNCT6_05450 [Streptomyces sp. 6-11-2]|nr:hypothetical protein TNCT6_05450 [Streptomyces sp. 6-11-2]